MKRKQVIAILLVATLAVSGFLASPTFALYLANTAKYSADDKKVYRVLQGGCADGTYAYFINLNKKGSYVKKGKKWVKTKKDICKLTKVKMQSGKWKKVKTRVINGNIQLNHGNDMTYNSLTKKLVAISRSSSLASAKTDAERSSVTMINPKTLKPTKQLILPFDEDTKEVPYAIAHNPKRNLYVAGIGAGRKFVTLDKDFNQVDSFKEKGLPQDGYSGTQQGIECDDDYIYILYNRYKGGSLKNTVRVYTWDGAFAGDVDLSISAALRKKCKYEAEHLFYKNNAFYMGFYGANGINPIHQVDLRVYAMHYDANGGQGEMKTTYLPYTAEVNLPKNTFTRKGHYFTGWNAYRESADKWYYTNGSNVDWYREGEAPAGYEKALFANKANMSALQAPHGTAITLRAQWSEIKPPEAPTQLTLTPGDKQIAVKWTTPENNGGTIKHYAYSVSSNGTDKWIKIPDSDKTTTEYLITTLTDDAKTPLENGTLYTVKIRAINSAGNGAEATGTATPQLLTIPAP